MLERWKDLNETSLSLQVNTVVMVESADLGNEAPMAFSGVSCISVTVHNNSVKNSPNKNTVWKKDLQKEPIL